MAESRAERKARRALIEAAEGSEEKSSTKSKSSKAAKSKSNKSRAKTKRSGSRRDGDKAPQTRSKRPHKDSVSPARKVVDPKSPCSIMKACGGCTALNRPYKKQLAAKQAAMEELFASLCEREGISVDPIRGMGVTLGARVNILRRVVFVIRLPLRLLPAKRALSAAAFLNVGRTKSSPFPNAPLRRRALVRFSTASLARPNVCIFPPLTKTSIWTASLCRRSLRLAHRPDYGHPRDRSARPAACAGVL